MEKKGILHTEVVRQHTVPKFLLENFMIKSESKKGSGQVFAFNKQSQQVKRLNVKDATVCNRFYNLREKPTVVSLESILCIYEGKGATVIKKILSSKDIWNLSEEEKKDLARFVAVQHLRSRGEYENQKHIAQSFYNTIKARSLTSSEIENYFSEESFENNSKMNFLNQIVSCDFEVSILMNKDWVLFETTADKPFYISDNPVTMYNDTKFHYRSNTGLALRGVQIYLPLSSTLMLAMICPSLNDALREERSFIYNCIVNNIGGRDLKIFERLDFLKSLLDLRLVKIEEWRLTHLNNLQVWRAEQFIFSRNDDFERVKDLVNNCPELTNGPRSIVL